MIATAVALGQDVTAVTTVGRAVPPPVRQIGTHSQVSNMSIFQMGVIWREREKKHAFLADLF